MTSSKIKSIFKRAVAAVISVSMLISLCVLPASAEEDYAWILNFDGTDPAAGNPEGWVDPASTIFDSMDSEHGNVMKIPSTAGDVKACGNVFARNTWESGDTLEARDYVFSFDFYAKQTNV